MIAINFNSLEQYIVDNHNSSTVVIVKQFKCQTSLRSSSDETVIDRRNRAKLLLSRSVPC